MTTGPPARAPEYVFDETNSPIRRKREPVELVDGKVKGKYPIAPCGHWTGGGDGCRHGCDG